MPHEQTRTRPNRQVEEESPDNLPDEGGTGALLAQAQGIHQVAQEAWDDCEHGADAEQEMQRRAQQGGQ